MPEGDENSILQAGKLETPIISITDGKTINYKQCCVIQKEKLAILILPSSKIFIFCSSCIFALIFIFKNSTLKYYLSFILMTEGGFFGPPLNFSLEVSASIISSSFSPAYKVTHMPFKRFRILMCIGNFWRFQQSPKERN